MISRNDIIGQTLQRCYQTHPEYDSKYELSASTLIIEFKSGMISDLCNSYDVEEHLIHVNNNEIHEKLKNSCPCFEELWGSEIINLTYSECFSGVIFLLSNNIVLYNYLVSPWAIGPLYEEYNFEVHDDLFDFWDGSKIEFTT